MTELSIRPEDVRSAIEQYVTSYSAETTREEVGTVAEVGDGIARVEGLYSTMANELLEFEGGVLGLALNLDTREVGVGILGDPSGVEEGQPVRRTGEVLSVPVGDGFLGRVVDPLGPPPGGHGGLGGEGGRRTGGWLSVPGGDGFLGRVVDPLGQPLDGKGDIVAEARRILELQAPTVVQRPPVHEPRQTGVKARDARA